jgi:hypothetical protein
MNDDWFAPNPVSRRLEAPSCAAFLLFPIWTEPALGAWQEQLYRLALAEAQAVASPSLPERDLLAAWN